MARNVQFYVILSSEERGISVRSSTKIGDFDCGITCEDCFASSLSLVSSYVGMTSLRMFGRIKSYVYDLPNTYDCKSAIVHNSFFYISE